MVGGRVLRLTHQPGLKLARAVTGEHLEAVDLTQYDKMITPRFGAGGVLGKSIRSQTKLRPKETGYFWGNNLA